MLLPQTKEREYRFRLALRMGLPIFALIIALVSHTLIGNYATLQPSFYIESIILLVFSIYFIFYLIYKGFDVKITDSVSRAFTREYLYKYLNKELAKKHDYTLILISIDNLNDINSRYGMKNGDKILESTTLWIAEYFKSKKIENFPLGHIKGGDFILGLEGKKEQYETLLELLCVQADELKLEGIEIKISGAIIDSDYSRELDYLVEHLFEMQEAKRDSKSRGSEESINPSELELFVIDAINKRNLNIMSQDVFMGEKSSFKEVYIKLKTPTQKLLYPKSYTKVINKLGLTLKYDMMVLEELILHTKGLKGSYALNISPSSLRSEKFIAATKELLESATIELIFILNEAEYYSHTSRYNTIINSLQSKGIRICIDRLGSIHTSFLYLRELDIDLVRFDRYYSNEAKLKEYSSIIDGFNLMAHERGLKTWIKNIQSQESLNLAQSYQIDYLQGKELSSLELVYEKS